eukprot:6870888-Prorocentrum_lima.AAC.1
MLLHNVNVARSSGAEHVWSWACPQQQFQWNPRCELSWRLRRAERVEGPAMVYSAADRSQA